MNLNSLLSQFLDLKVDRRVMREIPLEELVGTCVNGNTGISHKKCGGRGSRSMLPAKRGLFKCLGCNGYASQESVAIKSEEGRKGFSKLLKGIKNIQFQKIKKGGEV